jgi:UDP-glucose 4-epimerase
VKILITGGAGFIGSSLAEYLLQNGEEVQVIDNLSTGRKENVASWVSHPRFTFIQGSVTDADILAPLMESCDQCYHLASPVGVKYIMNNPLHTILDNLRGIDTVLALADRYRKPILIASTSEVYGKHLDLLDPTHTRKLREDDYRIEGNTHNHRWAYANTKAMNEFLAFAYHKERGLPCIVVRFFNTVGPRQLSQYGMVIPNFIQKALQHQPITIYGNGEQKRSFMHINDVVRAITRLMNHPNAIGQVFNLGSPDEITIKELAQTVIRLTDSRSEICYIDYQEAYGKGFEDMFRRTADISRISTLLNFTPEYDLVATLKDIIAYHKNADRRLVQA